MEIASRRFCEKHQLPLDARGECELCRLSAMPSKPPPSRRLPWAVLVGGTLLLGGAVLALGVGGESRDETVARGVPSAPPRPDLGPARVAQPPEARRPSDRPSKASVPVPVPSPTRSWRVQAAPMPPRPPAEPQAAAFTEDDARAALQEVQIEMYATSWCGSCRRARAYLDSNGIAYTEYDIDQDEDAKERLSTINPRRSIPTFQIDELVQIGFSAESLEYKLNQAVRRRLYD